MRRSLAGWSVCRSRCTAAAVPSATSCPPQGSPRTVGTAPRARTQLEGDSTAVRQLLGALHLLPPTCTMGAPYTGAPSPRDAAPHRRFRSSSPRASRVRAFSSGSGGDAASAVPDDDDDYLQAYEDLLLHAVSGGGEVAGDDGVSAHAAATYAEGDVGQPDVTADAAAAQSPADVLVEDALALLPANGTPVLLTDLSRSLDMETVCDLFGSVRAFVQLYPNHFACTQDPATGRWAVARSRHAPGTAAAAAATAAGEAARAAAAKATMERLDVAAMALEEELAHVRGPHTSTEASPQQPKDVQGRDSTATTPQRACARHRLTPAADAAATTVSQAWWPAIAELLPADGSPVAIAAVRASLPADVAAALHTGGVGLARCFKRDFDVARRSVALTADASALLRVVAAEGEPAVPPAAPLWYPGWRPFRSVTAATPQERTEMAVAEFSAEASEIGDGAYVMAPPDYDASADAKPWLVSLKLDETVGSGEGGEAVPPAAAGDPEEDAADLDAAAATGMEEVAYDGLGGEGGGAGAEAHVPGAGLTVSDLNLDRLRTAPVVPVSKKQRMAAAGTGAAPRPPRPSTPAEWLALHTAMAEARGWLTPMEMLDYLVECVPTFFIPMSELRTSDAIVKLVGPHTSMRTLVCRVYMYFVECDADKTQVRLAESVAHAQRGAANEHYAAWDPEKTEAASHGAGEATAATDAVPARRPGGGGSLKATAATRAFPVLKVQRPITSRLPVRAFRRRKPAPAAATADGVPTQAGDAATVSDEVAAAPPSTAALMHPGPAKVRASPAAALLQRSGSGTIALDTIAAGEIGYPFLALATQPAAAWPWWAQLLCVLPYDDVVPLDHIGVFYCPGLGDAERHRVWCAGDPTPPASAKGRTTPIPLSILRSPASSSAVRAVRLRPFWLAPGCTAELESDVLPAALVRQLRPAWLPVSRVLGRLSAEERETCTAVALRRPQAARLTAEAAVAALLRDVGRGCWVDGEGLKVRRYAAASDLDDHFHHALSLLYGFSSARTWEPVATVLDRAAAHVRPLLDHPRAPPPASPDAVGLIGMLRQAPPAELHAYLARHTQWLEVKAESAAKDAAAQPLQLLLRRRAALVSF